MSVVYDPPPQPVRRLLVDPLKHVARTYRTWLLYGVATVGLAPGMMAAELAEKKRRIEGWIATHPQDARRLSKEVEAGRHGNLGAL